MPSLIIGGADRAPVEADENVVRRNTAPVNATPEAAELEHDPGFNELAEDPNPAVGLTTRQLGSHWYERSKFVPGWLADFASQRHLNKRVNDQVSSSGTAAAREEAGEWGHGSMPFAIGIEPQNPAQVFGQDYFAANKPEGPNAVPSEAGLQPVRGNGLERDSIGAQSAQAAQAARDAATKAMYGRFLEG